MNKRAQEPERDERIHMEIIVDAYNESEQAAGWYTYLEDTLQFPFTATCRKKRPISPLGVGDEVKVIGMAPAEECEREIFVMIRYGRRDELGVPLSQLQPTSTATEETQEAVEDWLYWVDQGHTF